MRFRILWRLINFSAVVLYQALSLTRQRTHFTSGMAASVDKETTNVVPTTLSNPEILRYGRQMIVDGIGLPGQERLKNSKVSALVVIYYIRNWLYCHWFAVTGKIFIQGENGLDIYNIFPMYPHERRL